MHCYKLSKRFMQLRLYFSSHLKKILFWVTSRERVSIFSVFSLSLLTNTELAACVLLLCGLKQLNNTFVYRQNFKYLQNRVPVIWIIICIVIYGILCVPKWTISMLIEIISEKVVCNTITKEFNKITPEYTFQGDRGQYARECPSSGILRRIIY